MAKTSDGISAEDWEGVHELAVDVVSLSREGDDGGSERATEQLRSLLDELQEKYGPRPSILATRADYVEEPAEREYWLLAAFEQARILQDRANVSEISHSLASYYLEEMGDGVTGKTWLEAFGECDAGVADDDKAVEIARLAGRLRELTDGEL